MNLPTPPIEWSNDEITQFFDAARNNEYATFANLKEEVQLLIGIDALFREVIDALNHSKDWFAGFFVLRAHSNYLASCRMCWSGQAPECYALLRSCLENALYGVYLAKNPASQETWLRRHDSDDHNKIVRKEFKIGTMLDLAKELDSSEGEVAKMLYDRTIDYGAHPNELALTQTLHLNEDESQIDANIVYLDDDSNQMKLALKSSAQVGVCAISLFRPIYKERYDILGITDKLDKLKNVL